jgi:hypothetical protein
MRLNGSEQSEGYVPQSVSAEDADVGGARPSTRRCVTGLLLGLKGQTGGWTLRTGGYCDDIGTLLDRAGAGWHAK